MGDENLNPLEELKRLDQQVGLVSSLEGLKPIYYRLDEIAKQYANDFEVQLVVGDIKQHLVNRGTKLKEQEATIATPLANLPPPLFPVASAPPPLATPPPMPPQSAPPPVPITNAPTKAIAQPPAPPPIAPVAAVPPHASVLRAASAYPDASANAGRGTDSAAHSDFFGSHSADAFSAHQRVSLHRAAGHSADASRRAASHETAEWGQRASSAKAEASSLEESADLRCGSRTPGRRWRHRILRLHAPEESQSRGRTGSRDPRRD